jgi:hypothetical protein
MGDGQGGADRIADRGQRRADEEDDVGEPARAGGVLDEEFEEGADLARRREALEERQRQVLQT